MHTAYIQEIGQALYRTGQTASLRVKVVINGSMAIKTYAGKYSVAAKTCAGSARWASSEEDKEAFTS